MAYIWNRAKKVDKSVMPNVIYESFERWKKNLMSEYKYADEKRKIQILQLIKKQKINLDYNLAKLGYNQNYK